MGRYCGYSRIPGRGSVLLTTQVLKETPVILADQSVPILLSCFHGFMVLLQVHCFSRKVAKSTSQTY